jgi:hypothetical protein
MTGGSGTKGAAGVVDVTIMRTDRPAHGPLGSAGDTVVVIDVIRAFTTAAVLLAGGVPHLTCVSDAGQARRLLGDAAPGHLVVGEQEDRPFTDVDLPNSPSAVLAAEVRDRPVVLFTANGTPALVRVPARATILAGAIVNAHATAGWILANRPGVPVRQDLRARECRAGRLARCPRRVRPRCPPPRVTGWRRPISRVRYPDRS